MFDTINGIPVHPLVVHAVVVLLPLATLGTIAIAVRPKWRRPYGPLVVASALVATVLCPVATSSGEALEERVGEPEAHAELGESLIWFSVALLLASAALVYLQRQHERRAAADGAAATSTTALTVVAVVAVIAGLAAGVQVYRVGDSGAKAAWGDAAGSVAGD
ncbi:MAG: hypothetical protein Q7J48_14925 [Nocardioides sp.]|nr:hypothetical protein [Nocardioides sp.]